MFYVNGNPILEDELTVLMELKNQLLANGIKRFDQFKMGLKNIQFNCPIHNEGQEKRPSCGISIIDQKEVPAGTVHCFTCGYKASLEEMISHCFGRDDYGEFGKQWLIKNFLTVSVEERKDLKLDLDRNNFKKPIKYIEESELCQYRYYHPYMYERGLTNDIIDLFDVGFDGAFKLKDKFENIIRQVACLTFPVRDKRGNVLFIARRGVRDKFFHYPEGIDKPLYGLYELPKDCIELIVCEGIIDALTCWVYGKPAVALMGLGTKLQYDQLKKLPVRKLITGFDPDEAGYKATERLRYNLKGYKLITGFDIPIGKDINDLTKKEFENLKELM